MCQFICVMPFYFFYLKFAKFKKTFQIKHRMAPNTGYATCISAQSMQDFTCHSLYAK